MSLDPARLAPMANAIRALSMDAVQAANITVAGILSHASAMAGGERIPLPEWTLSDRRPFEVVLDDTVQPAWKNEASVM